MDLDKYNYYGSTMEAEPQQIKDGGYGRPIIVRRFQFKFPLTQKGIPTKEQLITPEYKKYLENALWADNLEMIQEPRLVYEKGGFSVFATCQAKKGNKIPDAYIDQLRPLQDKLTV